MSSTVSRTLPIGPVEPHWNEVRLGSPKSQATLKYTREVVGYGLEDKGVIVGQHPTKETMEVELVIADFRPDQYRYAFAYGKSMLSSTTLATANYSGTVNFIHKFKETVKLSGTVTVTLAKAKFVTGTIKLFKTDLSNAPTGYTRATDWTGTSSNGHIKRIGAGTIGTQETILVEYNATATSAVVYGGGDLIGFEAPLRLTYTDDAGKLLTLYFPRAKKKAASDIAIQQAAEFGGVAMNFDILADMTAPPGRQYVQIAKQI